MTAIEIQKLIQSRDLSNSISDTFFHFCIKELKNLNCKIRNQIHFQIEKSLLIYFEIDQNSIFYVRNSMGVKL